MHLKLIWNSYRFPVVRTLRGGTGVSPARDRSGVVTSTHACTIRIVRGGVVWTMPAEYCMNGPTRAKVLGMCRRGRSLVFERNVTRVDARAAEAAFLTGTSGAQATVSPLDARAIGGRGGRSPGPERIAEASCDRVRENTA